MIPKIAHQTAKTKQLSPPEARLREKLKQTLHDWEVNLWDDGDNLNIITEHFPHYVDIYNDLPFGVMRADISRYIYVLLYGGFYFDTDYEILRYIGDDFLRHHCILPQSREAHEQDNPYNTIGLGNAVFGSESGHPFWRDLIDAIFSNRDLRSARRKDIMAMTGPIVLTRFYHRTLGEYPDIHVPDRHIFHSKFSEIEAGDMSRSYGVHHCFASWHKPSLAGRARKLARRVIWASSRARLRVRDFTG
jgi:mannosyltransferase OCH1-like enzyme